MLNTLRMKPTLKILNVYSRAPSASKLPTVAESTKTAAESTLLSKLLVSTSTAASDMLSQLGASAPEVKVDKGSNELPSEFSASLTSSTTIWSTSTSTEPHVESAEVQAPHHHYEYDDTLDILMPLFVGLLVAIILGWMLMRYKMSAHQRSNYNGSIYCCPEECFNFCSRFLECQFR